MDIYNFAIDFERENRDYYLKRKENTDNKFLKNLFEKLAADEKEHEEIIRGLMDGKKVDYIESDILSNAKDTFEKISADLPDTVIPTEEVHIYRQAIEMERKSKDFYLSKAEETDLENVEKVFSKLAKEEAKHQRILENIEKMVDRPNTWLEDAEWYHIEEY